MNVSWDIDQSYRSALKEYLNGGGERALQLAYELGRKAVAEQTGGIEIVVAHQKALEEILSTIHNADQVKSTFEAAFHFLTETLSPYEMMYLGYRDALNTVQKSEERYRRLIETARDVIYTLSTDGLIKSLNPVFETITGWQRSEWIGKPFAPLIYPDDLPTAMMLYHRVLQGESPPVFELRIRTKGGGYVVGEFTTTPEIVDGKVIGTFGIARDVTERKIADQRLKESQQQLAAAQQMAHIGSWEWDIASNSIVWSEELYRIYGLKSEEFEGVFEAYIERVHPEDRHIVRNNVELALQTGRSYRSEYRILHADGTVRNVEARGEVVCNEAGMPVKLRGTCQDITERKRVQEQLRSLAGRVVAAQEEERRRLARELHDDLCQWLSGMKLSFALVEEKYASNKALQNVFTRYKRQINDRIVEVRRMSANLRPSALDDFGLHIALTRLCEEFEKNHALRVSLKTANLSFDHYPPDMEIAVFRIVQEALSNIVKHAKATEARVRLFQLDHRLTLEVEDNGLGFDISEVNRSNRHLQSQNGGLGLVSMRERAEFMRGTFHIESQGGKGTTIRVEIPLHS